MPLTFLERSAHRATKWLVKCPWSSLSATAQQGTVATLNDAVGAFNPIERRKGKTIIRVRP